jgi:hypothetical protein
MSFSDDMARIAKKTNKSLENTIKTTAIELFSSVIRDTPVDEGRAKGNWQATLGSMADGTVSTLDRSGSATISKMRATVGGFDLGEVIWLTNNLPYARRLEYGWSKVQAPQGMVRKNMARIQSLVAKEAKKNRI